MKHINIHPRKTNLSEKDEFKQLVESLEFCNKRDLVLFENFGIDVSSYVDPYWSVIEQLVFLMYGEIKAEIILWWLYHRFDEEGNLLPIELDEENEETKQVYIKTINELWNFLKKLDKNG